LLLSDWTEAFNLNTRIAEYGLKFISAFGYPALFAGLIIEFLGAPFPGEIVLAFTGFLVWSGYLEMSGAVLAAVTGSLTGTMMAYFIGMKFGRPFLEKYGRYAFLNKRKIDKAERWFNRHSFIVLLFGRFVPGIRPLSAYTAGIARMKFRVFLPLSFVGTSIWCIFFLAVGKHLGRNWNSISAVLEKYQLFLAVAAIVGAGVYLFMKIFKKKTKGLL
jgi:membrane protein DedA with SNARE-associated domain